jgi:dimeric dUTPase (all-alpha-NTP-PPase superfamily)
MNLDKLFELQKGLMERIEQEHPTQVGEDRFNKKILALLVEVGECANEWRGFKYWSNDQEPRTTHRIFEHGIRLNRVNNPINPLLEEYVDGLHFVLELGIYEGYEVEDFRYVHGANYDLYTDSDTNQQFINIYSSIVAFQEDRVLEAYEELLLYFIGLGAVLNFTWQQVEKAYLEKNEINHSRQENGY